jgi:ribosomal protein S18 acetylase RimI-like enzyme
VGTLGGRLVAMGGVLARDRTTAELKRMRVHPDVQRRGCGRTLLRRLEERAFQLGYSRLVLETTERQIAAIALYRSEGFLETGRGEVLGFPCILFAKRLPGAP